MKYGSALILIVGCMIWFGYGEYHDQPARDLQDSGAADRVSGAPSGTNPIDQFRDDAFREAIRGLSYDTGSVELANDWEEVLDEKGGVGDVGELIANGARYLDENLAFQAIESYTHAILTDQQAAVPYQGLARALIAKGRTEMAIAALRSALLLDPELDEARFELGLAYWRMRQMQQAVAAWKELLERSPDHVGAHERLSIAHYYLGDYETSWEHSQSSEALGHSMPPQFKTLLEQRRAELGS